MTTNLFGDEDEDAMEVELTALPTPTPMAITDSLFGDEEDEDEDDSDEDGGVEVVMDGDDARSTKIAQNSEAFVEQFALATEAEREELLKQVLPGSEDFYFYNVIHLLNKASTSPSDEAEARMKLRMEIDELLEAFKKLHPLDKKLPILEKRCVPSCPLFCC